MKSIKELLQLMLENRMLFSTGLCHWNEQLYLKGIISFKESNNLSNYIHKNRPSIFSSIKAFKFRNRQYFWKPKDIKPRIEWIKKHIEIQEKYGKEL